MVVFAAAPAEWGPGCVYVLKENGNTSYIATLQGLGCLIRNILAAAWPLLGLAFAAMVIWAGFQFILAGGEKEGLTKARKTLTYAVMGLFMAAAAWLVLVFLEHLTGFSLTTFQIGS